MARSPSGLRRGALRGAVAAAALLGVASAAASLPLALRLDPTQSALVAEDGSRAPVTGRVALELGAAPPLASATRFDVVGLALEGGGLEIGLDERVPGPGAGLLEPGGAFEIPALFLSVRSGGAPQALTLLDVTGTLAPDGPCGPPGLCLRTSTPIETGASAGDVSAQIVAAVPEPSSAALVALGAALLGAGRRAAPGRAR